MYKFRFGAAVGLLLALFALAPACVNAQTRPFFYRADASGTFPDANGDSTGFYINATAEVDIDAVTGSSLGEKISGVVALNWLVGTRPAWFVAPVKSLRCSVAYIDHAWRPNALIVTQPFPYYDPGDRAWTRAFAVVALQENAAGGQITAYLYRVSTGTELTEMKSKTLTGRLSVTAGF